MRQRIQIPEGEETILRFISNLTDEEFQAFKGAISATPAALYNSKFVGGVLEQLGQTDNGEWSEALKTVLAIRGAADVFGMDSTTVASDLGTEFGAKNPEEKNEARSLEERLRILLPIGSLQVTTQADRFLSGRANIFNSATINTQIQPLFVGEPNDLSFSVAVFSHELQIDVFESSDRNLVLRAILDDADLHTLRAQIDRALAKKRIAESSMTSTAITVLRQDASSKERSNDEV